MPTVKFLAFYLFLVPILIAQPTPARTQNLIKDCAEELEILENFRSCLLTKDFRSSTKNSIEVKTDNASDLVQGPAFALQGETTHVKFSATSVTSEIFAFTTLIFEANDDKKGTTRGKLVRFFPHIFPVGSKELPMNVQWEIPNNQHPGNYIVIGCAVDKNGNAVIAERQLIVNAPGSEATPSPSPSASPSPGPTPGAHKSGKKSRRKKTAE